MMYTNWPTTGSMLFVGDDEQALLQQALQHAKNILCENSPQSNALLTAESHPDFRQLAPEPNSQWIKIDQVRNLIQWTLGTPQIAKKQVAIVEKAHTLNIQSANALLKTVEEPTLNTVLILVSDKPALIPATLKSRCFWIRLRTSLESNNLFSPLPLRHSRESGNPGEESTALKLKIAKDLEDLQLEKTDPITLAAAWIKQDPKQVLHWLLVILNEKLIAATSSPGSSYSQNSSIKNPKLWAFIEKVFAARRALESPNSPNVQLLFESILFAM